MRLALKEGVQVAARLDPATPQAQEFPQWRVFLAVFTNGMPHQTEAQRRANLAGYVAALLHFGELAKASLDSLAELQAGRIALRNVALQLCDVTDGGEVLYQPIDPQVSFEGLDPMQVETYLRVEPPSGPDSVGRKWVLRCRPTPAYLASTRPWKSWMVLGGGLLLAGLLAGYLHSAAGRAAQVERSVRERTTELARANQELQNEIKERRQAEQQLAHERFQVETLMDTIPDHIYFKDRQSRFLRINKAQAARFKLSDPAQAIGKTDFDFFTREHAQAAFDDEQEILRTGEPLVGREEKETWPDGSVTWVSTTKQCLRDPLGHVVGTFGISRDITARKLAQEKLRESEERLQSILDNTSAVIYMKDQPGRYLLINRQFENLFHVTNAQVQGKTDHEIFPPELADAFRANDLKVLESPTPLEFEEVAPHKDGLHTYVSIKFRLPDAAGAPCAVCGVSTDITPRKKAEQALAQKTEELAHSNRELELFAYVASHDLQEPLRMIASYTQLLARRYKGQLDQDADEFIHYAVDGAERMQTLINDLLAYSRVGTRGKPFAPTDCNEVLRRALDNLKVAIEDSQAVIHTAALPKVMGDEVQLTQLFQNLLSNAIKFRGGRTPEIHVSAEMKPVPSPASVAPDKFAAGLRGEEWTFAVRDNGIGIEREFYDRIFVIFQRLHGRDEYPGTGIGLAVCKRIVERHGGRIWVESEPGRGSTFCFTLPHHEEPSI
jgi:PAS domain S-box-containing protein